MQKDSKILILGSRGLVGQALTKTLRAKEYLNILTPPRAELNLNEQSEVLRFFEINKPEYVFMAAAKVGGIQANNTYRADFIHQNLLIQTNVFEASFQAKVKKFLFLGSSCIYPKNCPQPIKEEYLLSNKLEPTNEPYAIAKIAGLKTAESFRRQYGCQYFSVMPTNLYGENDNFHPENSHVIPGLINRMAKTIKEQKNVFEVWGTGTPRREFMHVDDLANACLFLMETEKEIPDYLNIGTGSDITIKEVVEIIAKIMNFKGELVFNTDYPDGTPRKVLDTSLVNQLGWKPEITLENGLKRVVDHFMAGENIRRY
jgi:GDP-L-fucose synthase